MEKWIKFAIRDLDASIILYNNKFYPQALYLLNQSLEKVLKGRMVFLKWMKKGKEIGHNLELASCKVWYVEMGEIIEEAKKELKKEELKELDKDPAKFKELFSKKYLDLLNEVGKNIIIIKNIKKTKVLDVEKVLYDLDKQFVGLPEIRRKEIPKAITVKDYLMALENYLRKEGYREKSEYSIAVTYLLSYIMPKQDTFRYPEFQPEKIYNKDNILVKNFVRVANHLKNSCDIEMEFLEFLKYTEAFYNSLHSNKKDLSLN